MNYNFPYKGAIGKRQDTCYPDNYHNPGESVEVDISSYGRDGQAGGEDEDADIIWSESGNWN